MIKKDHKPEKSANILQYHQQFRSEMTSETVWNFCCCFSDVISWRNQQYCCKMLAVLSG